jgi:hypothetical protein
MIERFTMRCANPGCQTETLYFRSGSLHWIDTPPPLEGMPRRRGTRLIWLCAVCSKNLVVQTWRPAGQQVRCRRGEVIAIDRDRRRPAVAATPSHPVSQSA